MTCNVLSVVLDFPANTLRQRAWMREIIEQAQVANELHLLDVLDEICKQRMRRRNASGEHPFELTDADYERFTRHFMPPSPDEGFNVVVHSA